jgi:protein-L-isoaspartate(D-aspartate) O-methyltransferase
MPTSDQETELAHQKDELISSLKRQRVLKSKVVEEAFLEVRREDFALDAISKGQAYFDEPLPLGETGQTISAPHMVAIMLEELRLSREQNVLEIGTGTGYNAALIAHVVSGGGELKKHLVTTIERNSLLASKAKDNIERAGFAKVVRVIEGDGSLGYPPRYESPIYDRVTVTAGAPSVPKFLEAQLKVNGILLIPVGSASFQTLYRVTKHSDKQNRILLERERLMDCMFVPLVGEDAHQI